MTGDSCPGLPRVQIQGILTKVSARAIVVLVAGDPVPETRLRRGGFLDLIQGSAPGFLAEPWLAHDLRELDVLPDLTDALSVIVTGSPASVTEGLPWMERAAECLRRLVLAEVPVLGICFGHQLLGHALGGRVSANPRGREMGTVGVRLLASDPLPFVFLGIDEFAADLPRLFFQSSPIGYVAHDNNYTSLPGDFIRVRGDQGLPRFPRFCEKTHFQVMHGRTSGRVCKHFGAN